MASREEASVIVESDLEVRGLASPSELRPRTSSSSILCSLPPASSVAPDLTLVSSQQAFSFFAVCESTHLHSVWLCTLTGVSDLIRYPGPGCPSKSSSPTFQSEFCPHSLKCLLLAIREQEGRDSADALVSLHKYGVILPNWKGAHPWTHDIAALAEALKYNTIVKTLDLGCVSRDANQTPSQLPSQPSYNSGLVT
eukprot:3857716-Pleurochrysis_carterae.AAC.1